MASHRGRHRANRRRHARGGKHRVVTRALVNVPAKPSSDWLPANRVEATRILTAWATTWPPEAIRDLPGLVVHLAQPEAMHRIHTVHGRWSRTARVERRRVEAAVELLRHEPPRELLAA